jgi:hypothetical protein
VATQRTGNFQLAPNSSSLSIRTVPAFQYTLPEVTARSLMINLYRTGGFMHALNTRHVTRGGTAMRTSLTVPWYLLRQLHISANGAPLVSLFTA